MAQAKRGNAVKVHYVGKFEDGTVFDTSREREPLPFTIGEGEVIPGFEEAVVGMNPGESKKVVIPAENAYGPRHEEMVLVVDRQNLPEGVDPQVGQQYQIPQSDGQSIVVTVTDASDSSVTLDGNHPLAGRELTFEIELLEVA
ncbi:MAG: peptidylprolyl isomerase [Candidatus Manganitrophus sp.]|nr:peptidylprolyl isomerase [Candidatus Manganitrophus morganii]MDC4202931.1 peptidylprolyl isomerase [Candidatus Manganitrophus sp.]MDC4223091.1 peptidylprolyl isomerase [Candidatus Manganitrophus sp.]WDT69989.1 MAG: peptidylprolyl isomerase [Candidatus Manganitrophus sp.]WDT78365.1 MAG: peptidylprolyl isomerase [Candidatus Manganitrophus sp.]